MKLSIAEINQLYLNGNTEEIIIGMLKPKPKRLPFEERHILSLVWKQRARLATNKLRSKKRRKQMIY